MTTNQFDLAPLKISLTTNGSSLVNILEANGRLVCIADDYDAEQIVKSVNLFPVLLAVCKDTLKNCNLDQWPAVCSQLHNAIQEAEKEL